jgi:uncharacterized protein
MTRTPDMPVASPAAVSERHVVMDALRGFALLGIFLANILLFSGWFFLSEQQRANLSPGGYQWLEYLLTVLIDGKFYTLFSFLFGLGFALQLHRLEGRGPGATRLYLRRTTILLTIGVVHMFAFWLGDILLPYALLGFVLLACRQWADRTLLIVAGIAFFTPMVGYTFFWALGVDNSLGLYDLAYQIIPPTAVNPLNDLLLTDWGERLQASFGLGVLRLGYLFESWRWPKLFAIMLMGLWAGRRLIAGQLLENSRLLWTVMLVGIGCGVIAGPMLADLGGLGFRRPYSSDGFLAVFAYTFAVIPLGLAYAAAFALAWRRASGLLVILAAPGRMALSNYLSQTAVGLTVFYGIGFAQAGSWSLQAVLGFACAVYAAQVLFSNLWLGFFHYGPAEWLWRALTYKSMPPMRKTRLAHAR